MSIETEDDVVALKRIGKIVSSVLHDMLDAAEPGMTTRELDAMGEQLLERHGTRSTQYEHTMIITKYAPIVVTQHR